jgi:hypothetical protein
MHAGETLLVRVTAARSGYPVTSGSVTAEFWAPGADLKHDLPDHEVPCAYDERTRRWTARVDTAGWAPGLWTVRGAARGAESGSGWSTFPLAA